MKLADLPIPMFDPYVAVKGNSVFVCGSNNPKDYAQQIYVYDISIDKWNPLPLSGHYFGIPQIIGGRLVIIGGCLSTTKKRTNKTSTFYEANQTCYPDMLSTRSKPGVVTHLEHVIVARGARDDDTVSTLHRVQNDIEILNWKENSH